MARLAAKQGPERISGHFDDAHNELEVDDSNAPTAAIYFHGNGTSLHDGISLSFKLCFIYLQFLSGSILVLFLLQQPFNF